MPNDQATDGGAPTSQAATPADGNAAPAAATAPAAAPAADNLLSDAPADGAGAAPQGKAQGAEEPPAEEPKPEGAPEAYADFTMPDGVALNAELDGEFKSLAKDLNLPQEKAQQVADLGAKLVQSYQQKQAQSVQDQMDAWTTASKTDPEFGGDKLGENLAIAKSALATFGSAELKETLEKSGLGSHPEVIRLLVNVGKAISEDKLVTGGKGQKADQTMAQRMYPNMNP